MPPLPAPISALLRDPQAHLAGTDAQVTLVLDRVLLNELLDARPADTPVKELFLDPDEGNLVHLHLEVKAPVIGAVKRRITFRPSGPVTFPDNPWLQLDITGGFRLLDKPIIKLMQGQIAENLPKGIELPSRHLRLHIPALLTAGGYQAIVPMVKRLQLQSKANQLVITLHFLAQ